jgi:hypothetical protein
MKIIKHLGGVIVGTALGMVFTTISFMVLVADHYRSLEKEKLDADKRKKDLANAKMSTPYSPTSLKDLKYKQKQNPHRQNPWQPQG